MDRKLQTCHCEQARAEAACPQYVLTEDLPTTDLSMSDRRQCEECPLRGDQRTFYRTPSLS